MDDACGSDNEGRDTYCVELSEVDLDAIPAAAQASAWASCDGGSMIDADDPDTVRRDMVAAGCCFDYGARAPLFDVSTDNVHKGFRACRAESYSLTRDAAALAARMDRPVNRIGSTAPRKL
jgi:hypothetical protein